MYMLVEHHSKEWFEKFHKMTNYSLLNLMMIGIEKKILGEQLIYLVQITW